VSKKIFIDTEFTDLASDAQLISIGCVCDDGQEFYAETTFSAGIVSDWVVENVIPHLTGRDAVLPRRVLRQELALWVASCGPVEFAIDSQWDLHFLLNLSPKGFPSNVAAKPFMIDARPQVFEDALQLAYSSNNFRQHHALDDAKALRLAWKATHV
jgi:hypothetical protein